MMESVFICLIIVCLVIVVLYMQWDDWWVCLFLVFLTMTCGVSGPSVFP